MSLKIGSVVQVWNENYHTCTGWGVVIQIAISAKDQEEIPLIQLESGKKIWGNRCHWIEEKKAIEIGVRLFRDIYKEPGN